MRKPVIVFAIALVLANSVWADTPHEAAARQIFKVTFAVDRPRMVQVFVTSMGMSVSRLDKEALAEALDSKEVESIYVRNYMKIFSESELVALAEMMSTPAYRLYVERTPMLVQAVIPEVAAYATKAFPEIRRLVAERNKTSAATGQ